MQRLHFFLSILSLAALLAGCAPRAAVQPEQVKALDDPAPTNSPEIPTPLPTTPSEVVPHDPPASCPISLAPRPDFMPPSIPFVSPISAFPNEFWFGSSHLWTALPTDAIWYALPHNPEGYTQKIFWWSDLFSLKDEPQPELAVTGQRLDGEAPLLQGSRATNAYGEDIGEAMLTGVDFPSLGCWKITGQYKGTELSFVIWVAP